MQELEGGGHLMSMRTLWHLLQGVREPGYKTMLCKYIGVSLRNDKPNLGRDKTQVELFSSNWPQIFPGPVRNAYCGRTQTIVSADNHL